MLSMPQFSPGGGGAGMNRVVGGSAMGANSASPVNAQVEMSGTTGSSHVTSKPPSTPRINPRPIPTRSMPTPSSGSGMHSFGRGQMPASNPMMGL